MNVELKTYQTVEVEVAGYILTDIQQQSDELYALKDMAWYVRQLNLHRGDLVTFRTVEVTSSIGQERCYKQGYNGSLRDVVVKTERKTLSEESLKLWRSKKREWYWIEQKTRGGRQ